MAILFAEGWELGTTFAENQALSGLTWTQSAYVNATSTFTIGSSSLNVGRSLSMAIYPSSTTSTNYPYVGYNYTFQGSSGSLGYQFSFGFQAKLNSNKTSTLASTLGLRSTASVLNGCAAFGNSVAVTSSGTTLSIFMGASSNTLGTFVVPDLNAHYYTFTATKVGTNIWSVTVYLDNTIVYSGSSVSASMVDASSFYLHLSNGGTTTIQANIFSEIDNFYFVEGPPLGNIQIKRVTPTSDVTTQWTKIGSAATHHESIDSITTTNTNGIAAIGSNITDSFSTSDTLASGKIVVATNTTVYGSGSDTITLFTSNGGQTKSATATFDPIASSASSTGWDSTLPSTTDLTTYQFGVSKS